MLDGPLQTTYSKLTGLWLVGKLLSNR